MNTSAVTLLQLGQRLARPSSWYASLHPPPSFRALIRSSSQPSSSCRTLPSASLHTSSFRALLRASFQPSSSCRTLHTSSVRALPPILLTLAAPLTRVTAFLAVRSARLWWKLLPTDSKNNLKAAFLKHRLKLLGGVAIFCGCLVYAYESHIQICPITNRRKFVALTPEQMLKISESALEAHLEEHSDSIVSTQLPGGQKVYKEVSQIVQRLLKANKDLPQIHDKNWTIILLNEDIINASVLPTGHIFLFLGMYQECVENGELNKDRLAVILAHEMAHAILNHTAEILTMVNFLQGIILIPMAVLWAFIPSDGIAVITHWFVEKVVQLIVELPFSRALETEADSVGVVLAAKACFDVREAPAFWARMLLYEETAELVKDDDFDEEAYKEFDKMVSYASTHPAHSTRQEDLTAMMEEAIKLRIQCNCPELDKEKNPAKMVEQAKKKIIEKRDEIKKKIKETHRGVSVTFESNEEEEKKASHHNSTVVELFKKIL